MGVNVSLVEADYRSRSIFYQSHILSHNLYIYRYFLQSKTKKNSSKTIKLTCNTYKLINKKSVHSQL